MKKIIVFIYVLLICICFLGANTEKVNPTGYVVDKANIISGEGVGFLTNLINSVEAKTEAEIAVVTIESLDDYSIEEYAVNLFEKWGIGKKDKDNGLLLLVAMNDRKVRIEVGYGLEHVITDIYAKNIIESYIVPQFKAGDYTSGIIGGVLACSQKIAEFYNVTLDINTNIPLRKRRKESVLKKLLFFIFFFLIFGGRFFFFPLLLGGSGFWRGGGGGFGGGGGSFGGFGGGFSGGGGASGGW